MTFGRACDRFNHAYKMSTVNTYHTLHDHLRFSCTVGVDNAGTIDEVNGFEESHILPDFGLTGNRGDLANLLRSVIKELY